MMRSRKTVNAAGACAKLDELQAAIQGEVASTEADPFDEAMIAAVLGVVEAMKAEADALADLEARLGKLARNATVTGR